MSDRILVIAGTAEGRELAAKVNEAGLADHVDFSVATEYGEELLRGANVLEGRMDGEKMLELLHSKGYKLIVDASHPYASAVTENAQAAASAEGTEYIRLLREESLPESENIEFVDSPEEASAVLSCSDENVLLTTGSKDLKIFSSVPGFSERFFARVLPSEESLKACGEAGLKRNHIICMQGPFTHEMNAATLRQYGCQVLVTKSSGRAGGYDDKVRCATEGFRVIVIKRPTVEQGCSLEEVWDKMKEVMGVGV